MPPLHPMVLDNFRFEPQPVSKQWGIKILRTVYEIAKEGSIHERHVVSTDRIVLQYQLMNEPVIDPGIDHAERRIIAADPLADRKLRTSLPLLDQLQDQFRRILQVGGKDQKTVTRNKLQPTLGGMNRTKISGQLDDSRARALLPDLQEYLKRVVS